MEIINELKKDIEAIIPAELSVESLSDYNRAGDILKVINSKIKNIELKRVELTKPILDAKKNLDAGFKALSLPLEKLAEVITVKMALWYKDEKARLDLEQSEIEKKAIKDNPDKADIEVAVVNEIKTNRGEISTTSAVKVMKWEVENLDEVERGLLMLDEKKINALVRGGQRYIKGLKIYEDISIRVR